MRTDYRWEGTELTRTRNVWNYTARIRRARNSGKHKKISTHQLHGGARTHKKTALPPPCWRSRCLRTRANHCAVGSLRKGIRGTDFAAALLQALPAAAPSAAG